jgi:hypothetical protein
MASAAVAVLVRICGQELGMHAPFPRASRRLEHPPFASLLLPPSPLRVLLPPPFLPQLSQAPFHINSLTLLISLPPLPTPFLPPSRSPLLLPPRHRRLRRSPQAQGRLLRVVADADTGARGQGEAGWGRPCGGGRQGRGFRWRRLQGRYEAPTCGRAWVSLPPSLPPSLPSLPCSLTPVLLCPPSLPPSLPPFFPLSLAPPPKSSPSFSPFLPIPALPALFLSLPGSRFPSPPISHPFL